MKKLYALTLITALALTGASAFAQDAAPAAKVTKTTEKTLTTNYTVTTQRVGKVGYHSYPKVTQSKEGGVTVEKYVNDVKTDTQVIKPEPELVVPSNDKAMNQRREYYTDAEGEKIIQGFPLDVKVHRITGGFNN